MTREQIIDSVDICEWLTSKTGAQWKNIGGEAYTVCPLHADKKPSFRVNRQKKVWRCDPCDAGGSIIDLVMRLDNVDAGTAIRSFSGDNGNSEHPVEVARYDYTDERGELLFQVVRFHPKTFKQRHKVGDKWVWNMTDVRRVPYRLPEVLKAKCVIITEGEKDADALVALGFVATTNVGGAGKWLDAYSEFLRGKSVIICPDQDEPGKKHADAVIKSLTGIASSISVWNVDTGKDASDWIKAQSDQAKLVLTDVLEALEPLNLAADLPVKNIHELEAEYRAFLAQSQTLSLPLRNWLPTLKCLRALVPGELCVVMADTGAGKTAVLQNLCLTAHPMPVLFFEMELPGTMMFERFVQIGLKVPGDQVEHTYRSGNRYDFTDRKLDHVWSVTLSKMNPKEMERIINTSELRIGQRPSIVMVDYIGLLHCPGASRYERMSHAAEQMKVLAKSTNTIFIVATQIHRKPDGDQSTSVSLHDAKDSGSIENSAGLVLGAWRTGEQFDELTVRVLKSTKGGAGTTVKCNFDVKTLSITEQSPVSEADIPREWRTDWAANL